MVLFGLVTAVGLGAVVFTGIYALSDVKVGGPLYDKIKLGNDLVADILPPPEYVIESYLEATLALNNPVGLATHRDRLVQLKKEYDERHEFWSKSDLNPTIKAKLVGESHREVQRFWTAVEQVFLPALAKSDMATAAKSYSEVTTAYLAHRALIDEIVKKTNDDNAAFEAGATQRVNTFTVILWSISGLVFLIIGGGIFGVGLGVIQPMTRMTDVMTRLARGELDTLIPSLNRGDEVGAMAKAGSTNLVDVVNYAEAVTKKGFVFMDTPGYDPVAATGQVAGGANLVCFTTGRGSVFGCKPAPSIKLATNSAMFKRMEDDMDVNCGTILDGEETVQQCGQRIFDLMLKTASGQPTKSESFDFGGAEFAPWVLGATM